jgi:hypothetical protein
MTSNWQQSLLDDPGWKRPLLNDEDGLIPDRIKVLRTRLIDKGLLCVSGGNVYIFLPVMNKWSVLCSNEAIIFLNSLMGMENATVQYTTAFRPYVSFLEMNAMENLAGTIQTSVCLGTSRLRVSLKNDGLVLHPVDPILPSRLLKREIASLCYMPVMTPRIPGENGWSRTDDLPMYNFISPLFKNPVELQTIEWAIGNALVDPCTSSKAIILYGKGGTGKSTLTAAIRIALMGCCSSIPDKSLIGISKGLSDDVASIIVGHRMVIAGDVGGIDDATNLSVIKSITGHDYISIPPLSARSSCSLIYATNRLDDPRTNKEWLTPQIMRRVLVVLMDADALTFTANVIPQDATSRLDFVLRCIHTRMQHRYPPVSSMSIILTLMAHRGLDAFAYLTEDDDSTITDEESMTALGIISGILDISSDLIGELVKAINPNCIRMVRSTYVIKGIRPTDAYMDDIATL